jgi:hypothetical protein
MLCDRGMIHNMCGPLIKSCELLYRKGSSDEEYGRTIPSLTNIMRHCIYCAVTVNNSVIMAYHYSPNINEHLYLHRSLLFL